MLDLVWIGVLVRLREFGYPLDKLKLVKTSLFDREVIFNETEESVSFFEIYTAMALALRKPVYMLVFSDGNAEPVYYEQFNTSLRHLQLNDYIVVNVHSIMQPLFPGWDLSPLFETTVEVDQKEFEVLFTLRTGTYESINVKMKNGEINTLELEQNHFFPSVHELLRESDFQNLEIKQRDGNTVHATQKTLKRL